MAQSSAIMRKYSLTDGDLAIFANSLVSSMQRDIDEFENYGVTESSIESLREYIDEFQDLPDDEILRGEVGYSVESRNRDRNEITKKMKSIAVRAKAVYGVSTAKYRSLAPTGVSDMTDSKLLTTSNQVYQSAMANISDLSSEGLTISYLESFKDIIDQFEDKITEVENKRNERDVRNEYKINKGNELYAYVVKYCDYGKTIWEGVSESKYNDYIIYTNVNPGSLLAPQNFMYAPASNLFTWDPVTNATSYELQISTDGIYYTDYWNGEETECVFSDFPDNIVYFKVRARNAGGFGPSSSVIEYNFALPLTAPTNFGYNPSTYMFSWSEVVNAIFYEFQYKAIINTDWTSFNVGNDTNFLHADPPGEYVARVRATRGSNNGPWSEELNYHVNLTP